MSLMTMFMIVLSFPITYVIYGGVFQIPFNDTLIQLSIFIVLGIAADDVFVFCDAWRQSAHYPSIADDDKKRMAYAFKRAFKAILVTSSTTSVAFLANGLSEIVPIRAFGIFAAIIIPVNFVLIILIMPAIQMVHDRYLAKCCTYRKCFAACCKCCISKKTDKEDGDKENKDALTRFFSGPYDKCIIKLRYVWVIVFVVIGIVFAAFAF